MRPRGHPSLPHPPHPPHPAHAVAAALQNPYAQYYQSPQYSQAYLSAVANSAYAGTTPQGYSFSSAYDPGSSSSTSFSGYSARNGQPGAPNPSLQASRPPPSASWYQPGDARCRYKNCSFMGSKKSVEIHMMDRHLIYPPGWEKRQKNDWDADPSLKGKPVPIPGTGLTLDTPEALDAWLAERKKRWPSASKVEEKKRKVEEAIERGQLDPSLSLDGRKKRRLDDGGGGRGRVRGRGRGRGDSGWGRGRGRGGASVPATREPNVSGPLPPAGLPPKPVTVQDSNPTDSDSDSDDAPEAVSFKPPAGLLDSYASSEDEESKAREPVDAEPDPPIPAMTQQPPVTEPPAKPVRKPFVPQPKKPPNNPFGSRPSLLRRLLLPEIRVTVSNFSQAIHFLVENDFLENVEMKPGQASEKMIEVIGESNIADHTSGGAEKLDDA